MQTANIQDYQGKRVHIIGICGASLCGLADILQESGYQVTGSDMKETIFTPYVKRIGVPYTIGHSVKNVEGADIVVHSAAVPETNVELKWAKEHGVPTLERSVLVGQIMERYPVAIGVSGCHGKTTISSMIGLMLLKAQKDPTIHVGGVLHYLEEGGTRVGKSEIMVAESCEYMNSFLHFSPTIEVINNIDDDHLDFFKDIDDVYHSFQEYVQRLRAGGIIFGCADDPLVQKLLKETEAKTVTYGLSPDADWTAQDIEYDDFGCATFTAVYQGKPFCRAKIHLPGEYNVTNALGAMAVCVYLGCDAQSIVDALEEYAAAERRFQYHGEVEGVKVYHDFAHHPTAVKACLKAAQMFKYKKLWVVFQCNSFSRAYKLKDRFVAAFDPADCTIIAEIFPGREVDTGLISGQDISDAITARGKESLYIPKYKDIGTYLHAHWQPGDMVLMVGSGDINAHVDEVMHPENY